MGFGFEVKGGDYLIMGQPVGQGLYRVDNFERYQNPYDMWKCEVVFVPPSEVGTDYTAGRRISQADLVCLMTE